MPSFERALLVRGVLRELGVAGEGSADASVDPFAEVPKDLKGL